MRSETDYQIENGRLLRYLGQDSDVVIPEGVTEIDYFAFRRCTGVKSVRIPASVICIGSTLFDNCTDLERIVVAPENPVYDSRENCNAVIQTESNTMIIACKSTVIPTSVTGIELAFSSCAGLTAITIPDSVTHIGLAAFFSCTGLTSITLPERVTEIEQFAFKCCCNLASITIQRSVKNINYGAFFGCDALTDVYYTGTEAEWKAIRIDEDNDALLHAAIHFNA